MEDRGDDLGHHLNQSVPHGGAPPLHQVELAMEEQTGKTVPNVGVGKGTHLCVDTQKKQGIICKEAKTEDKADVEHQIDGKSSVEIVTTEASVAVTGRLRSQRFLRRVNPHEHVDD